MHFVEAALTTGMQEYFHYVYYCKNYVAALTTGMQEYSHYVYHCTNLRSCFNHCRWAEWEHAGKTKVLPACSHSEPQSAR